MSAFRRIRIVVCFFVLSNSPGWSQPGQIKIPLIITQSSGFPPSDTVWFGLDSRATHCIDTSLGEFEVPPLVCGTLQSFCPIFLDNRTEGCFGEGTVLDLREYQSTAQEDTYKLQMSSDYYPIAIHWPSNLNLNYDSAMLMDRTLDGISFRIDMLQNDSLRVPDPSVATFYIRTWGPHGTTGVAFEKTEVTDQPSLLQNYPNPFNPKTVIRFKLHDSGFMSLKVYDIVGREVAVLLDEKKSPGEYEIEWDSSNLPSGVYLYRLTSGGSVISRKLLIIR